MPFSDPKKQKQAQHESYLRNKEKVAAAQRVSRAKRKAFLKEIKESSPCMDCKAYYPYYIMDFDHRDPEQKTDNLAKLMQVAGIKRLQIEIAKCDLVCANCHRERTFGDGRYKNQYS